MKTITKYLFLLGLTAGLSGTVSVQAQNEGSGTNDAGIRIGEYTGITFRHFGQRNNGLELSLTNWVPDGGAIISGMFEHKILLPGNFSLYFGGGAFAGSMYAHDVYYTRSGERVYVSYSGRPFYGLTGVFGADYTIPKVPISFGLDFSPRFFDFYYPYSWDLGLNIRYHF
jgi:hypothetical protein